MKIKYELWSFTVKYENDKLPKILINIRYEYELFAINIDDFVHEIYKVKRDKDIKKVNELKEKVKELI